MGEFGIPGLSPVTHHLITGKTTDDHNTERRMTMVNNSPDKDITSPRTQVDRRIECMFAVLPLVDRRSVFQLFALHLFLTRHELRKCPPLYIEFGSDLIDDGCACNYRNRRFQFFAVVRAMLEKHTDSDDEFNEIQSSVYEYVKVFGFAATRGTRRAE